MNILIVGAGGFLGSRLYHHLRGLGYTVTGCSRSNPQYSSRQDSDFTYCNMNYEHQEWQRLLDKIDLVINCVGVFQSNRTGFHRVHYQGPVTLFQACRDRQVKVIQISALGAEQDNPVCEFLASKKQTDNFLCKSSIDYKIFYPGIVIGTEGKSTQQLFLLAQMPIIPLLFPRHFQLPIITQEQFLMEITSCISNWSKFPKQKNLYSSIDVTTLLSTLREKKKPRIVELPPSLSKWLLTGLSKFRLGVFNHQSLTMLNNFNCSETYPQLNNQSHQHTFSINKTILVGLKQFYFRYYFIFLLSFIWCWSGLVSLFNPQASMELISILSYSGLSAVILIISGAALDLLLGLLIWSSHLRVKVIQVQSMVIIIYSIIVAIELPQFWLHPFAPIIKNLALLLINYYLITAYRQ